MSDTHEPPTNPISESATPEPSAPVEPSGQPVEPAPTPAEPAPQPIDPTILRNAEAYKGARPLIDVLVQHDIKTPDDLQRFIELDSVARERNLDIGQLTNVLRGQQPQDQPQGQAEQEQQFLTEDKLVSVLDQRDAMSQFNSELTAMDTAVGTMRQEVAQATGLDPNNETLNLIVNSLLDRAQENNYYPERHALHQTKLKPLDSSQIAQAKDKAIQSITAFRGQHAIASAQDSLQSIPAQPTGSGLQSKPGEGVSQIYNPHTRSSQNDVSEAESILARALGRTQPGTVANSV